MRNSCLHRSCLRRQPNRRAMHPTARREHRHGLSNRTGPAATVSGTRGRGASGVVHTAQPGLVAGPRCQLRTAPLRRSPRVESLRHRPHGGGRPRPRRGSPQGCTRKMPRVLRHTSSLRTRMATCASWDSQRVVPLRQARKSWTQCSPAHPSCSRSGGRAGTGAGVLRGLPQRARPPLPLAAPPGRRHHCSKTEGTSCHPRHAPLDGTNNTQRGCSHSINFPLRQGRLPPTAPHPPL